LAEKKTVALKLSYWADGSNLSMKKKPHSGDKWPENDDLL
jgi:hypothetical protein